MYEYAHNSRNNIEKSIEGIASTRLLTINNKHILWAHVRTLFLDDMEHQLYRTKLTFDHVNLTPSSRMSVSLSHYIVIIYSVWNLGGEHG